MHTPPNEKKKEQSCLDSFSWKKVTAARIWQEKMHNRCKPLQLCVLYNGTKYLKKLLLLLTQSLTSKSFSCHFLLLFWQGTHETLLVHYRPMLHGSVTLNTNAAFLGTLERLQITAHNNGKNLYQLFSIKTEVVMAIWTITRGVLCTVKIRSQWAQRSTSVIKGSELYKQ